MNKAKIPPYSSQDSSPKTKSPEFNKLTVERNDKKVPPDGGWGWMIVLGSFIEMIIDTFPLSAFSILFSPILMSNAVSSTKISWIYNVHSLVWSLSILFIGPLCDEFGWRKVAIFGGISNSISVILSAFAPNPDYLFFSFSLLGGFGIATGTSLSPIVVSSYFEKHRGFALGIILLGGCTSTFFGPVAANYLLENYSYIGASLIFGAIVLNQCVGAALYQPVEWHLKSEEIKVPSVTTDSKGFHGKCLQDTQKLSSSSRHSTGTVNISILPSPLDAVKDEEDIHENVRPAYKFWNALKSAFDNLKSLRYIRVNLIALGYCGFMLGYVNFQMWVPFVITNAGYSLETAAWCFSLSTLGNIIGRILMTLLSDRKFFNVRYGFMFGLLLTGSSIIAFSFVNDIKFYRIFICVWGLGIGSSIALYINVMINVMGIEMLPTVLGVASLFQGLGGISIGTLTGVVRDSTSSYTYALWMLGGCEFVAFCLYLFIPCGQKFDEKKYPKAKIQQNC